MVCDMAPWCIHASRGERGESTLRYYTQQDRVGRSVVYVRLIRRGVPTIVTTRCWTWTCTCRSSATPVLTLTLTLHG